MNDREFMGSQLLLLAGRRVAHYLLESHKMEGVELLSNVSPALTTWLRSLVGFTLYYLHDFIYPKQIEIHDNNITVLFLLKAGAWTFETACC